MGSDCKQREVGEVLAIDVVAGQESWEKKDKNVEAGARRQNSEATREVFTVSHAY